MWTTSLQEVWVESSAWALVSGAGSSVPAARACSTRVCSPSALAAFSPAMPATPTTKRMPATTIATRIPGTNVYQPQPTARRRAKKWPIAPWRIGSSTKRQESAAIARIAANCSALRSSPSSWGFCALAAVMTITGVCQR